MKRQVRRGVFETNSSSTHVLVMCSNEEYELWEDGKMILNGWDEELIPVTEEIEKMSEDEKENNGLITKEKFDDYEYYETFEESYKTKTGENVIAFGYY